MKISLASKEMQSCILGKKTRLRESEVFSRVYISPDLTSEERVARAVLVKKRSPGKSFRIKGGEVVEVSSGTQYYSLRVLFIQVSSFHLFHIIVFLFAILFLLMINKTSRNSSTGPFPYGFQATTAKPGHRYSQVLSLSLSLSLCS